MSIMKALNPTHSEIRVVSMFVLGVVGQCDGAG